LDQVTGRRQVQFEPIPVSLENTRRHAVDNELRVNGTIDELKRQLAGVGSMNAVGAHQTVPNAVLNRQALPCL
jgi:hypothetical protein